MRGPQKGSSRIPVLTYHSIDRTGSVISTTPEKFESQMRFLKESSFNVVSLDEIRCCINENRPFPSRAAVITFDDGYFSVYSDAFPVLKALGFPATVFLVTDFCGRTNRWPGQPDGIPSLDLLGWDQIMEMADNGIEFGSHTMSHPNLSLLTSEQAENEIVGAMSAIHSRLGGVVPFFAYPYGIEKKEIRSVIAERFSGACSVKLGFVSHKSDVYFLPRIDMYYYSKNSLFRQIDEPLGFAYIKSRSALRSVRTML